VKWFNADRGYGFITPNGGGEDVFVHVSALERSGIEGRYGPETPVPEWRERLVCSCCGSHDVDMVVTGTERR
jgi:hypothetical protein